MTEYLKNLLGELGAELVNPERGVYTLPGRATIYSMGRGWDVFVIDPDGRQRFVGAFMHAGDAAQRLIDELQ